MKVILFLEVDQVIYTKVHDAMFKMEAKGYEIFEKVIPLMGGFYIGIWMLRTIYEQFNKCGVTELLYAEGLGEKDTITRNVKGGDIKEGILLHNNFLQALLRHITDNQALHKLQTIITHEIIDSMIHYCRHKTLPTLYRAMAAFMNIYLEMVNI